ncbi:MAG: UDP-N-acetyl-D-glucosamine/UDP-N-acetyl-D-galactosamine dehydrogenase [Euryarchaeota archaeon]|jgi:UDP-N-acetyl-D-galactosamine dehydrogenase|nr:UDP-N-acetyl-D-glucosamine/UDP-N-acetyl-D-galactosamine dehydrogenase [Euryarchaeota archaeon]MDN5340025.1 UDP-N-acetyl-D-glucosamine/UDP-N-acetyl-D-galactosamine dehydrogenase [Euryarchaeota archaeon]
MVQGSAKGITVCVVGLGYVGYPLADAFSRHLTTIGYDLDMEKIAGINAKPGNQVLATTDPARIREADVVIIAVPTPVTKAKDPDISYVVSAAETVGRNLKDGAIVVLESTVYPGLTEEVMIPTLERVSGKVCGKDFFVGYSPERINPGDAEHTLERITKIVAGMDSATTERLAALYGLVTNVYIARDIRTAEAAKVIENIQRDLNIALMNELSIIFRKMGLDTKAVLEAAGTKWNFHNYRPGLVGGHCIPVDPYYLVYKVPREAPANGASMVHFTEDDSRSHPALSALILDEKRVLVSKGPLFDALLWIDPRSSYRALLKCFPQPLDNTRLPIEMGDSG